MLKVYESGMPHGGGVQANTSRLPDLCAGGGSQFAVNLFEYLVEALLLDMACARLKEPATRAPDVIGEPRGLADRTARAAQSNAY
jgi:hypothetical protein